MNRATNQINGTNEVLFDNGVLRRRRRRRRYTCTLYKYIHVLLVTNLDFSKMWIDDSQNANFQTRCYKTGGRERSCECHMYIT